MCSFSKFILYYRFVSVCVFFVVVAVAERITSSASEMGPNKETKKKSKTHHWTKKLFDIHSSNMKEEAIP